MTEPLVYLNGRMAPASQAHLAIYDAGIVLGATVTEMTRTFRHQLWRLEDHLDRLFGALKYTRMEIGLSREELASVSQELVAHNTSLLSHPDDEVGLIHFVTAGEYATYAGSAGGAARTTPTVCAHTFVMPWELWAKKMQSGTRLVTPSIRHVPPQCYDPKMKYRSRMHYFLADQEARLADPEAAALLLDLDGNLAETSGANILLVERGVLVSPTTRNTLPGISRATAIRLAERLGIPFQERDLQVYNAINADEAFLSTTPYCLMPVSHINGIAIGNETPGPIYRQLLAAWGEEVGLNIGEQIQEGARRRMASA